MAEILSLADFGAARDDVWRLGYRSTDVEEFKQRLVEHGFAALHVSDQFDVETSSAVRALQRALDVDVNGSFDTTTRTAFEDDMRTGGGATRMAGMEWSRHGSPDTAMPGMMTPGAAGTLSAVEMPQQIQIPHEEPFWKNPMLWLGVGGAALLIYFLTRSEEDGAISSVEGDFDVEVMDEGGVEDPAEFFGEAPKHRRRKPAARGRKPASRAKRAATPKKRKPRKKKEPADESAPVSGAAEAKPKRRRRKKGDLAAAPMPTDTSPVNAPAEAPAAA